MRKQPTPEHVAIVLKFHWMLCRHQSLCKKHATERLPGIVGFEAEREFMICNWCGIREQFWCTRPVTVINDEQLQWWVCKLTSQLDEFYCKHIKCAPDRAQAKQATLIAMATADGITDMGEHVSIGDVYTVYPNTLREMAWGKTDNPEISIKRLSVWADQSEHGHGGWLPVELFRIEDGRKPQ